MTATVEEIAKGVWRIVQDDGTVRIERTSPSTLRIIEEAAIKYERALRRLAER